MMALSQSTVLKLYNTVIEDVISGVRECFMDEGVDEQVLQELKQVWETKLHASKAVELAPDPPEARPPPIVVNNQKSNGNRPGITKKEAVAVPAHGNQQPVQQPQPATQPVKPSPQLAQQSNAPPASVVGLDPSKMVPIQITLPAQPGLENSQARVLTIQVPASALQSNQLTQVLTGPLITATMGLPPHLASSLLQQHVNAALQGQAAAMRSAVPAAQKPVVSQVDGANDSSDDDLSDASDDNLENMSDDDNDRDDGIDDGENAGPEEDPLNSGDDVTDEDTGDMFDTENVVVCQYDKITRCRNKWKFYLKDGIMNLNGKDYIFQRSTGDAEW